MQFINIMLSSRYAVRVLGQDLISGVVMVGFGIFFDQTVQRKERTFGAGNHVGVQGSLADRWLVNIDFREEIEL